MGIALAFGILLGVQAGVANEVVLLTVLIGGLALVSAVVTRPVRPFVICGALGCLCGALAGWLRAPATPPPYAGPSAVVMTAQIASDPHISSVGRFADVRWMDSAGVRRNALALLPAA